MKSFEHYQKQISRATERAFTDEQIKNTSMPEHLVTLFRPDESKFNRIVAMLSMLRAIAPLQLKYDYQTEHLPIDPEKYEFQEGIIGQGGENDVYLLQSKEESIASWVLKMNHADGGGVNKLVARAREIKDEYETVKEWFAEMPGFVPAEHSLIMENPRTGKPAIATLQKYYGTDIKDLFKTMLKEDLPSKLEANPELKADVLTFIRISKEREAQTGQLVDLLGSNNLSLIELNGKERLVLLDPHFISNPERSQEDVQKRQKYRLNYLCAEVGQQDAQQRLE